jgi:hypothetical protein
MSVKISALTPLTGANTVTDDEYVIVDKSVPETKKQTRAQLFQNIPNASFSGTVGIGTTSPAGLLDVIGSVGGGDVDINIFNNATTGRAELQLGMPNATANEINGGFVVDGTNQFSLFYSNREMRIATGPSYNERVRIESGGNIGIGITPTAFFHINGTIRYTNRPAAGTITAIGYDSNGDLRNASSSLRYKHSIADYEKGLDEVMELRPVVFKFDGEERENIGFIAEEIDDLGLTEVMLYDEENRPEGILYANMVALLTKALQEANAKIDALAERVAELEDSI